MYPKLYDSSGNLLAVLDNIVLDTAKCKRVINGEFTFSFDATEKELKSEYFVETNKLKVADQTFVLSYIENSHEFSVTYSITAEHVFQKLQDGEDNQYSGGYTLTGTPTEIMEDVFTDTDFSVGTVDFTDNMTLSIDGDTTKHGVIKNLAAELDAEIDFSDEGYTIDLLDTIGQDNNYVARFGQNLLGVRKIIDDRGDDTETTYSIDVIMLKNSNGWLKKDLGDLEILGVGDEIRIIDSVTGLDVENRVYSREWNPIFETTNTLEIANTIELVTDTITDIETSTSNNSASISAINGEIELIASDIDDNSAAITVNANSISAVVTDVDDNSAAIDILSDEIDLKVDADGVIASINVSTEGVVISADKVELDGFVEFNNLTDGTTSISGSNIDTGIISGIEFNTNQGSGTYISIGESGIGDRIYWYDSSDDLVAQISVTGSDQMLITANDDVFVVAYGTGDITLDGTDIHIHGDVEIYDNVDIQGNLDVTDWIEVFDGQRVVFNRGNEDINMQSNGQYTYLEVWDGEGDSGGTFLGYLELLSSAP